MKYAELPQHCPAIVINSLPCEPVTFVECVHTAKRNLSPSARRRQSTPSAELGAANQNLNANRVFGYVLVLNENFEIGQRLHQARIERAHAIFAFLMLTPRLVIVLCHLSESGNHAFKIMRVLEANVFLDDSDPRCLPVSWK